MPEVYVPYTREVWPGVALLARSRLAPTDAPRLVPALQRAVLAGEPELPVHGAGLHAGFRPLDAFVDASLTDRRSLTTLLAAFAAAAPGLAALGLYGVIASGRRRSRRVCSLPRSACSWSPRWGRRGSPRDARRERTRR